MVASILRRVASIQPEQQPPTARQPRLTRDACMGGVGVTVCRAPRPIPKVRGLNAISNSIEHFSVICNLVKTKRKE